VPTESNEVTERPEATHYLVDVHEPSAEVPLSGRSFGFASCDGQIPQPFVGD
jgi:hypothetical protein